VNGKVFQGNDGLFKATDLDVGKLHRIRIFAKGYETSEQTVTLDAREQALDIALVEKKAATTGKKAAPVEKKATPVEKKATVVEKKATAVEEKKITPPKKKTATNTPAKPKYGYLTINAIPWAEVYYKGRKLKLTPIRKKKFPAGKISLVLKHPSNKKTVNVTLKAGEHKVLPPTRMLPK